MNDKENQIDIVSKYHAKNDLANALYCKQDEFDLSNPFEVANCVINLGYRKINENELVISKEEYRKLKLKRKNAMAIETARKVCEHIENDNKKIRKETAREILERGKYCMPSGLREWIIEQFGVDLGEEK